MHCRALILSTLLSMPLLVGTAAAQQQDDKQATVLLNNFMTAMTGSLTPERALKDALPYLHPSLLDKSGKELSDSLRKSSFKSAHRAAKLYAVPVKVTEAKPTIQKQVAYRGNTDKGLVVEYFIARKEGVSGGPAAVPVFFPENGGLPKVVDISKLR